MMTMYPFYSATVDLIRSLPVESQELHRVNTLMLIEVDYKLKNLTEEERAELVQLLSPSKSNM